MTLKPREGHLYNAMPKPGYATITLKKEVRDQLLNAMKASGYKSLNQFLTDLLKTVSGAQGQGFESPRARQRSPFLAFLGRSWDCPDWSGFREWLLSRYCRDEVRTKLCYARRYYRLLLDRDLTPLHSLSDRKRAHVMRALAALSKYLGCYDLFQELRVKAGLKWSKSSDTAIIARLSRDVNPVEWALEAKRRVPSLTEFIDFLAATGLRVVEAIWSWNLLAEKGPEGYYNPETGALEHFRHEIFLRRTKKAYISFIPESLLDAPAEPLTYDTVRLRLKRAGLKLHLSDLREYWATYMTRHLTRPEIDMLQGRVGTSVFMAHYFNPNLIRDLRTRTLQGVAEILEELQT